MCDHLIILGDEILDVVFQVRDGYEEPLLEISEFIAGTIDACAETMHHKVGGSQGVEWG